MYSNAKYTLTYRIRLCIWMVTGGLLLSGVTAFPLEAELRWLAGILPGGGMFYGWITTVYNAVHLTNIHYPYLSYGIDWLAFAHLMLAVLFAGALKDPVKNIWVIEFGIIASVAIFPLAFIAGWIRQVPVFWRLIDCSFGVVTLSLLLPCYFMIKKLTELNNIF
jgi:hypothetical protein